MPSSTEELRTKYLVMSNMWLLSKMRSPGRPLFADLDENTWWKFLQNLWSEEYFRNRVIQGGAESGPDGCIASNMG